MFGNRRGAEAVEFAMVIPVVLALLAGIFDYGWFFHQHMVLQDAVRHGARSAAVLPQDGGDVEAVAVAAVTQGLEAGGQSGIQPVVTVDLVTASNGEQGVRVEAVADYTGLWGLVALPYELRSSVVMRREDQPDNG